MVVFTFTKNPCGFDLKRPVTVDIPEPQDLTDQRQQQYIIDACLTHAPFLIAFIYRNSSLMELTRHLLLHRSSSLKSLTTYGTDVFQFCSWAKTEPDQLIKKCKDKKGYLKPIGAAEIRHSIDDYIAYLQTRNLAPSTIFNRVSSLKVFFRINFAEIQLFLKKPNRTMYESRAPTLEELRRVLDVATLRERVIVTMLGVSGLRVGTLAKLKYRHVKADLEKHVVPVLIETEAEITKGKYHSYWTFLNQEGSDCLEAYLNLRRRGSKYTSAEVITDDSPLIRPHRTNDVRPAVSETLENAMRNLFFRAGIATKTPGVRRYAFQCHGLRKFFRSQMLLRGVRSEYIEFMLGHRTDKYLDIKTLGPDYLRNVYKMSGISIRPYPEMDKIAILTDIISKIGLNPQEILKPEVLNSEANYNLA